MKKEGILGEHSLVISPYFSKEKIETLFKSAQKDIQIYIQYLKDQKINEILLKQQKKGVQIQFFQNDYKNI